MMELKKLKRKKCWNIKVKKLVLKKEVVVSQIKK